MILNKGIQIPTAKAINQVLCGDINPQINAEIKIMSAEIPASSQWGLVSMKAIEIPERMPIVREVKKSGLILFI